MHTFLQKIKCAYYFFPKEPGKHCNRDQWIEGVMPDCSVGYKGTADSYSEFPRFGDVSTVLLIVVLPGASVMKKKSSASTKLAPTHRKKKVLSL